MLFDSHYFGMLQDTCRNISEEVSVAAAAVQRCYLEMSVFVSDDEVRAGLCDSLPRCIDRSL